MRKIALVAALLLATGSGSAWSFGNGGNGGNGGQGGTGGQGGRGGVAVSSNRNANRNSNRNANRNSNRNANRNSNRNSQGQRQGQGQGQGQGQAQGNVGLGSGNETSLQQSYVEDYSETYDDYTPPAYAPSMGVSTPCMVGVGIGGGIPGFSVSGGGYYKDQDCVDGETIRMGVQSGDTENIARANKLLEIRLEAAIAANTPEPTEEEKQAARDQGKFFTDDVASTYTDSILDYDY